MKKVFLFLVSVFIISFLTAQETVETWQSVKIAAKKSDEDIQDAKKNIKPATWMNRARVYTRVYTYNIEGIQKGMEATQLAIVKFGKTPKKRQEGEYEIHNYDNAVDFYIKNGKVDKWVITDVVNPEPLIVAYEAYKKADELDADGKLDKKLKENLEKIKGPGYMLNLAYEKYENEDYQTCINYFETIIDINSKPYINIIDTASIFNTGAIAKFVKDYEKAIKYLTKASEYGYGGATTYLEMYKINQLMGDTVRSLEVIKEGIEKYPQTSNDLFIELINYYLPKGQDQEAMTYLGQAIEKQPDNASLYFARGTLYDKKYQLQLEDEKSDIESPVIRADFDNAIKDYSKTLAIDSKYADAYLNLGAINFNTGIKYFDKSNDPKLSKEKYESCRKFAIDYYQKSIPFLDKVIEFTSDDKVKYNAYNSLRQIYYKLSDFEKSKEMKLKMEEIASKMK